MAYNTRQYGEFKDDLGRRYKIEILQNGYSGGVTTFNVDERGFELTYPGEGQDIYAPMKASECTFGLISTSGIQDLLIQQIFENSEGEFILKIGVDVNGGNSYVPYWRGVIVADTIEEKDEYYPRLYEVRASCGLEFLKSKRANDITAIRNILTNTQVNFPQEINNTTASSNSYDYLFSHFDIILKCLLLIPSSDEVDPHDNFINSSVQWWESNMPTPDQSRSPLQYTANRPFAFGKLQNGAVKEWKTCYDILKEICTLWGMRIMQSEGRWYLLQYNALCNMASNSVWYRRFNKSGGILGSGAQQYIVSEGDPSTHPYKKMEGGVFQTYPLINRIIVEHDKLFDWLTPAGFISAVPNIEIQTSLPASVSSTDYIDTFLAAETTNTQALMIQGVLTWKSNLAMNTTNFPGISFSFGGSGYRIYFYMVVKAGNQYLFYNGATGYREWSTNFTGIYLGNEDLSSSSATNVTDTFFQPGYIQPLPVTNNIEFYPYYRIKRETNIGTWVTITSYTDSDFDVDILDQNNNIASSQAILPNGGSECRFYLTDSTGQVIAQQRFTFQNQRSGTDITSPNDVTIKTIFGNASDYGITDVFTGNNITTAGTIGTDWFYHANDDWDRAGIGSATSIENLNYNILVLLGVERLQAQPNAPKLYIGTLAKTKTTTSQLYQFHEMFVDAAEDYWIPNGIKFSARSGETQGEWVEVIFDSTNGVVQGTNNNYLNVGLNSGVLTSL